MDRMYDIWGNYPYSNQVPNQQFNRPNYTGQSPLNGNSFQNSYVPQFQTNKILVLGPEEALMKATYPNSLFICFNQNKPEMYEVRVDNEGRKKIDTYYLTTTLNPVNDNNFEERLSKLERTVFKEVNTNDAKSE